MQHAIERVKRPGESQEALDGKKDGNAELMRFVAGTSGCFTFEMFECGTRVLTQFDNGTEGSRPQIVNDKTAQLPPEEFRKLKVRVCRHLHSPNLSYQSPAV